MPCVLEKAIPKELLRPATTWFAVQACVRTYVRDECALRKQSCREGCTSCQIDRALMDTKHKSSVTKCKKRKRFVEVS